MATIIINGTKIEYNGGSIKITNDKIFVDGNEISGGNTREVNIIGNIKNLSVAGRVDIKGNVEGDIDAGGSVSCGDVGGSVDAGGSVTANNIKGDIDAGGSVHVRR